MLWWSASKPWLPSYSVDDKNKVWHLPSSWGEHEMTSYCPNCPETPLHICQRALLLSAIKAGSTFFLYSSKSVHVWCLEAILIANNYTPGSNKGNICVLHTPKSNCKHPITMVTIPPTVNKIIAHRLQLFLKIRIVNTKWTAAIFAPLESLHLKNTKVPENWVQHPS